MPARTGRMPALPRNATLQALPQFSRQRRSGAEEKKFTDPMNLDFKYNADGLIPAIVQETGSHRVLMMAWMNRAAH